MESILDIRKAAGLIMHLWLFILMFQMGLSVTAREIIDSARQRSLMLRSLTANFIIVPFAGLLLLMLFKPSPAIAIGFLTLIVFAGAPFGPPVSGIARGDMPFSIGLMLILTLLSTVISPFLLIFLSDFLPGTTAFKIDHASILKVVIFDQVIPIAAGLAIREFLSEVADSIFRPIKLISIILTILSMTAVVALDYQMLLMFGAKAFGGMFLLFIISLGFGWLMGGPRRPARKTLAIITTIRNAAAALVIIAANFPGSQAFASALAYSVFSVLGSLIFAYVSGRIDL